MFQFWVDSHMLLSRLPLSALRRIAQLAYLRHAANIHPGPGSNPQIKLTKYSTKVEKLHFLPHPECQGAIIAEQFRSADPSEVKFRLSRLWREGEPERRRVKIHFFSNKNHPHFFANLNLFYTN